MMDKIFAKTPQKQFEFDEKVADVFDDMLTRSIPYYKEVLSLSADFALSYAKEDSNILDLGTSTGSMLAEIAAKAQYKINLYGIDSSLAMIKRAQNKLNAYGVKATLVCGDILKEDFIPSSCVIANYTLQFIRPMQREILVKKIYDCLEDGGVFIFSEKIMCEDKMLDFKMIEYYLQNKKKQGYSDFEIAKKREALENVLIPYSTEENKSMLQNAGFKHIQILFCWVNFATFIALKS
ncbi:MAG: carboxy-S-adenosyl-L-methionine synthase CmoA [Helicobacter sp.]|nr:carboxy-S-adenosyl-L-methionine synthase CmoA [Helicobacter sp.]